MSLISESRSTATLTTSVFPTPSIVVVAPDDTDESMYPHDSMTVGIVAGTLTGSIVILTVVLVSLLVLYQKRRSRQIIQEAIEHSGTAFKDNRWSPTHGLWTSSLLLKLLLTSCPSKTVFGPARRISNSSLTCYSPKRNYFIIGTPVEDSSDKPTPPQVFEDSPSRSSTVSDIGLEPSLSKSSPLSRPIQDSPPSYADSR